MARLRRGDALEVGDRFRRLGGGGEDRAVVGLQDCQPVVDVLGVIDPGFRRDPEFGAQERGAEFGDLS